jgi:hypothetical protein
VNNIGSTIPSPSTSRDGMNNGALSPFPKVGRGRGMRGVGDGMVAIIFSSLVGPVSNEN